MSNYISQTWRRYRAQPGVARELFMLAVALLLGAVVAPALIWVGGGVVLGPYSRDVTGQDIGGPLALYADFFRGLAAASLGHWVVLLGPYVIYLVIRISRNILRA
ncbi:MAG: hypothetical protein ABIT36_02110 [Steroidobacteraceae bacterium]